MGGFVCYTYYVIERLAVASYIIGEFAKLWRFAGEIRSKHYAGLAQLLERFLAMEEARS